MKLHYNISKKFNFKNPVVTVGAFDGVHLGHKKIASTLVEKAKEINGESVIISFFPHPRTVLNPNSKSIQLITSQKEKFFMLQNLGIDHLVILPFTNEFSQISYKQFVEDYICKLFKTHTLVIGYDHQFGKEREGNYEQLLVLSKELKFNVEQIPALDMQNIAVSSTKVREALNEGNVTLAKQYLGHEYFIVGKIIKGNRIGNTIGYPTANVNFDEKLKLLPANGVYAVLVKYKDQLLKGMLNVGIRPTIGESEKTIEVNIFDFSEEIYKKEICVFFVERMRDELKFSGLEELTQHLHKDKELCLKILR
ncbi:MAG: bifunctional riboflavin kinase/FAD synthetase [Bacteroidota bacterium]